MSDYVAAVLLAVLFGVSGCQSASPPPGPTQRLTPIHGTLPNGRLGFSCGIVLGMRMCEYRLKYGEGAEDEQLWPKVWRFQKESIDIIDDKERHYDPGRSWQFCDVKGGGKCLDFEIAPWADAKELSVHLILLINEHRFEIKEEFIKAPNGKWEKANASKP